VTVPAEPVEVPISAARPGVTRRLARQPIAIFSATILLVIVLIAVFAPLIAPVGPTAASLADVFGPPAPGHPLGFDSGGRDLFARLVWGARISLLGALLSTVIALAIGVPSGLVAGYYGNAFDATASWLSTVIMALPGIVVLLAFRAAVSPSIWAAMALFGVLLSPAYFRLVRSAVSAVRGELYIDAARVSGLSDARIIGKHIFGVVRAPIIIQTGMVLALSIVAQAGLEFLGLGDLTQPSWGSIMNEGFQNIFRAPQILFWPGLVLTVTIAGLALLASAVRDALEAQTPQTKRRAHRRPVPLAQADAHAEAPARIGAESGGALVRIDGLQVTYGEKVVVSDVSVVLESGEVVGLVGESGSGKTQTVLSLLGLLPEGGQISRGIISIDGEETTVARRMGMLGRHIAYVPQEPMSNLDPAFTIGSQLTEPMRRHLKLSRRAAARRAEQLLARVGINEPQRVMKSYPHEISGGMAQRVLIAGAISCEPRILVADEPTTALDVTVQAEILDLLRELQRETGMGVLIVTHNFGVVADLCDRVYVMRSGRVVEHGAVQELFTDPQEAYTQELLAATLEGGPSRVEIDRMDRTNA
jgi:peptide/nickel transport system permease protein